MEIEENSIDVTGPPELEVRVTEDGMAVLVSVSFDSNKNESIVESIISKLCGLGIQDPPNSEIILSWLQRQAEEDSSIVDAVLVRGEPGVPAQDGEIKWAEDFFSADFVVDEETGKIDYRQRSVSTTVEEGQLLATLVAPVNGKVGCDVYGKPVEPDAPYCPDIFAGENVFADSSTGYFISESVGRIRWNKDVLSVDLVYTVEGSVGLGTGNISHPGAVVVKEDILSGSKVEAIGDIEVMGVVEDAQVQTGGNLIVHGGIVGSENQNLIVAGSVHAKFIMDAHIQAGGDVVVEKEIMNSTLMTRGKVYMPRGRLVGGETTALMGIEVGQAGTNSNTPTRLIVGEDYELEGRILLKKNDIRIIEAQLENIKSAVAPFMIPTAKIPSDKKEAIKKLIGNASELQKKLDDLHDEVEKICDESEKLSVRRVQTNNFMFPRTVICAKDTKLLISEEWKGAVRASYSHEKIDIGAL